MRLSIVSPGYPPVPGGVTHHTGRLVRHWSDAGHGVDVLGSCAEPPEHTVAGWRDVGVSATLIQYVPFLYGRRGLSWFPRRLATAARAVGIRMGVFVHEPWVPRTRLPWLILSPLQRRQLLRLLEVCDVAFTAVPTWRRLLGGKPHLLYVGSTLGDPPATATREPPLPAPVVFSPFASGLRWDWIVAAVRAIGAQPGLTVIGATWETASRHLLVGRWADPTWDWRGYLDAPAVLRLLSRARLVLAPFVDGLTGRRTSAFAAASVGARLVSSRGHLFDPTFDAAPFGLASTKTEFCELAGALFRTSESANLRQRRLAWYEQALDPKCADERLLALLAGRTPG